MKFIVEEWVENYFWNFVDEGDITTYWGNLATITKDSKGFNVRYKDPVSRFNIVEHFKNEDLLDKWLESIYSPSYKEIVKWGEKYE